MKQADGGPSDLTLERYALGELSDEAMLEVDRARASDPSVETRLAAIEASNREILARYRPEFMARTIEARLADEGPGSSEPRLRSAPSRARRYSRFSLPIGIAALLLLAFFVLPPGGDATRAKGGSPHLVLFRKGATGPERLSSGSAAAAHDILQIAYETGEKGYGTIFSIDGRGSITFHLPPDFGGGSGRAPELFAGKTVLLPSAFELDDAPAFERFFLVLSPKTFDLRSVDEAARALAADPGKAEAGDLRLPTNLRWFSFTVPKKGGK